MRTLAAGLAVLFLVGPTAEGAEPNQSGAALIDQCVSAAADAPQTCIGLLEKPCLKTEGGATTAGAMRCADAESNVWAQRAAAAGEAIAAKLEPQRLRLFRASQDAWRAYWRAQCASEASIYLGGSLAKVVAAQCVLRETALRAIALERQIRMEAEAQ